MGKEFSLILEGREDGKHKKTVLNFIGMILSIILKVE